MPCGSAYWGSVQARGEGQVRSTDSVQPWQLLQSRLLLGTAKQHRFTGMLCGVMEGKGGGGGALRGGGHPAHPNKPLAKSAVGCLPEEPAMMSFCGLVQTSLSLCSAVAC